MVPLILAIGFAGASTIWMQFRVEPVITWGQIGEALVGVAGFVWMIYSIKKDVSLIKLDIQEALDNQEKLTDKVQEIQVDVGQLKQWRDDQTARRR